MTGASNEADCDVTKARRPHSSPVCCLVSVHRAAVDGGGCSRATRPMWPRAALRKAASVIGWGQDETVHTASGSPQLSSRERSLGKLRLNHFNHGLLPRMSRPRRSIPCSASYNVRRTSDSCAQCSSMRSFYPSNVFSLLVSIAEGTKARRNYRSCFNTIWRNELPLQVRHNSPPFLSKQQKKSSTRKRRVLSVASVPEASCYRYRTYAHRPFSSRQCDLRQFRRGLKLRFPHGKNSGRQATIPKTQRLARCFFFFPFSPSHWRKRLSRPQLRIGEMHLR